MAATNSPARDFSSSASSCTLAGSLAFCPISSPSFTKAATPEAYASFVACTPASRLSISTLMILFLSFISTSRFLLSSTNALSSRWVSFSAFVAIGSHLHVHVLWILRLIYHFQNFMHDTPPCVMHQGFVWIASFIYCAIDIVKKML